MVVKQKITVLKPIKIQFNILVDQNPRFAIIAVCLLKFV